MKALAINGSPRKGGNTSILINQVLDELKNENIETEHLQIGGKNIRGCNACYICKDRKDLRCAIQNDVVNEYIKKMFTADAIILGSPTYFANITTEMKALIDRAGVVARTNGFVLKNKIGTSVVAVRRGGAVVAFNAINHFFFANQMIVPGSSYWNMGFGGSIGEVESDKEGLETMKNLGQNIAWLLKKIFKITH